MKTSFLCILGAALLVVALTARVSASARGAASESERPECIRCVPKQRPVCGRDSHGHMKTFTNACQIRRENCLNHSDYYQVRKGSCN